MAMVMPGTLRSASLSVVVACCFMVCWSMTLTAWGVSWRLVDGMEASGGLWLRPFLSAWSLTETGPNCTGPSAWGQAGWASSRLPNSPLERERPLRDADMIRPLQGSAFSTWLASLMAFWRKGLAWYAIDERTFLLGED